MLEILAKYHTLWISFVRDRICDASYSEDVVQETYLKLHRNGHLKKAVFEGKVKKSYMFQALKNMTKDLNKKMSRVIKQEVTETVQPVTPGLTLQELQEINERHHRIRQKLRSEHRHYDNLYMIYTCADNPTQRELAKETGQALTSIHQQLKTVQELIKTA